MPQANSNLQYVDGDTLEECQKKLFDLYGRNYHIENRESILKPHGFFGLRTKAIQRVWYTTVQEKVIDEVSDMERNRQAILASQTATVLKTLANKMDEMNSKINSMNSNITSTSNEIHPTIKQIEDILEQNEFTMSYIRMIEEKIRGQFSLDELDDFNLVERYVVDWIGESIKIAPEKVFRPPHVVVVIGPTGVGKTTTISKLAASTIKYAKTLIPNLFDVKSYTYSFSFITIPPLLCNTKNVPNKNHVEFHDNTFSSFFPHKIEVFG